MYIFSLDYNTLRIWWCIIKFFLIKIQSMKLYILMLTNRMHLLGQLIFGIEKATKIPSTK